MRTKRSWLRRTIRIGAGVLGGVALAAGALVVLFGRQDALLLAGILWQPLLSNTQPPPMFADQPAGLSVVDLGDVLHKKFPLGTDAGAVRAALRSQGFKPPPPPVACWPRGKPPPSGQVVVPCPEHDPSKTLEYHWGRFPCGDTIVVWWSSGKRDELTDIGGYHGHGCL